MITYCTVYICSIHTNYVAICSLKSSSSLNVSPVVSLRSSSLSSFHPDPSLFSPAQDEEIIEGGVLLTIAWREKAFYNVEETWQTLLWPSRYAPIKAAGTRKYYEVYKASGFPTGRLYHNCIQILDAQRRPMTCVLYNVQALTLYAISQHC